MKEFLLSHRVVQRNILNDIINLLVCTLISFRLTTKFIFYLILRIFVCFVNVIAYFSLHFVCVLYISYFCISSVFSILYFISTYFYLFIYLFFFSLLILIYIWYLHFPFFIGLDSVIVLPLHLIFLPYIVVDEGQVGGGGWLNGCVGVWVAKIQGGWEGGREAERKKGRQEGQHGWGLV